MMNKFYNDKDFQQKIDLLKEEIINTYTSKATIPVKPQFHLNHLIKNIRKFFIILQKLENFLLKTYDSTNSYPMMNFDFADEVESYLDSLYYCGDRILDRLDDLHKINGDAKFRKDHSYLRYYFTEVRNRIAHPNIARNTPFASLKYDKCLGFVYSPNTDNYFKTYTTEDQKKIANQKDVDEIEIVYEELFRKIISEEKFKKIFANLLCKELRRARNSEDFLNNKNLQMQINFNEFEKLVKNTNTRNRRKKILEFVTEIFNKWDPIKSDYLRSEGKFEHKYGMLEVIIINCLEGDRDNWRAFPNTIFTEVDSFEHENEFRKIYKNTTYRITNTKSNFLQKIITFFRNKPRSINFRIGIPIDSLGTPGHRLLSEKMLEHTRDVLNKTYLESS
jgi:hypothetical protein